MKLDRDIALLCLISLVDMMGYATIVPLLPFIMQRYGAGTITIGAILALYSICQLLTAPLLGHWSDHWGRKPLLLASQFGSLVGFVLLARAEAVALILLSRVIDGLSAGNVSLLYTVVLDRVAPAERSRAIGLLTTSSGIGILIGPLIGSALGGHNLAAPAYAAAALSGLSIALTALFFRESRQVRTPSGSIWHIGQVFAVFDNRPIRRILRLILTNNVLFNAYLLALPLYLQRRFAITQANVGIVITILFGFAALFQVLLLQRVLNWLGDHRAAQAGFALYASGALVSLAAWHIAVLIAGGALVLWGLVLLNPVLTALLGNSARAMEEGRLMGINQSAASLGQILGPLIGYGAIVAFSTPGLCLACFALAVLGLGLVRQVPPEDQHAPG